MGRHPHPLLAPATPYWEIFARPRRVVRDRFDSRSPAQRNLFHANPWRFEGAREGASTPHLLPQGAPAKSGVRARRRARTLDAGGRARREGPGRCLGAPGSAGRAGR